MSSQADRAERFLALHEGSELLLIPNPWDPGSAKLLASLGFKALATTSSGSAATLGRLDGSMALEEAIASAAAIVEATDLPVSADLENGFADDPAGVAATMRLALDAGLAGASIEDYTQDARTSRSTRSTSPASGSPPRLRPRTTARRGWSSPRGPRTTSTGSPISPTRSPACRPTRRPAPTSSTRPGLSRLEDIRQVVTSVDLPVNVLGRPGAPSVAELAVGRRAARLGRRRLRLRGAGRRRSKPRGSCSTRGPTATSSGPASVCRPPAPPSRKRPTSRRPRR